LAPALASLHRAPARQAYIPVTTSLCLEECAEPAGHGGPEVSKVEERERFLRRLFRAPRADFYVGVAANHNQCDNRADLGNIYASRLYSQYLPSVVNVQVHEERKSRDTGPPISRSVPSPPRGLFTLPKGCSTRGLYPPRLHVGPLLTSLRRSVVRGRSSPDRAFTSARRFSDQPSRLRSFPGIGPSGGFAACVADPRQGTGSGTRTIGSSRTAPGCLPVGANLTSRFEMISHSTPIGLRANRPKYVFIHGSVPVTRTTPSRRCGLARSASPRRLPAALRLVRTSGNNSASSSGGKATPALTPRSNMFKTVWRIVRSRTKQGPASAMPACPRAASQRPQALRSSR